MIMITINLIESLCQFIEHIGIGVGFQFMICSLGLFGFLIQLLIAYWMYKDAEKRGEEEVLWLIVGLIAGIIGLIIWLLVRPGMSEVRSKSRLQHPPPGKPCPDCDGEMRWIEGYNRWYCERCKEYK